MPQKDLNACYCGQVQQAAQQLLRALRGERSQVAFARRLGYRGNPITDWECGRRIPTAREALRAAAMVKIDVLASFTRFQPSLALGLGPDGLELGPWLSQLNPNLSVTELAARTGHGRSSVSRWLAGKAQPRLNEFLELVDAATGRVQDLVAELVAIEQVPALQARFEASSAAKRIAFDQPWTEAVMRVLETLPARDASADDVLAVAQRLGLHEESVASCLALLEKAALVRREGCAYDVVRELTVDTRGGKDALLALKAHWARVTAERALRPGTGDLFAYNVFSASAADVERIRQLLRAAFRQTRSIVTSSAPCQEVALVNVQLVRWPEEKSS